MAEKPDNDSHKSLRKFLWQILAMVVGMITISASGILDKVADRFNQIGQWEHQEKLETATLTPGQQVDRNFTLVNQNGERVSDREFDTRAWIVFFGYTHCPDICPVTLSRLSSLWGQLPNPERAVVLFVTVDPERDTWEALGEYMKSFNPNFVALTGSNVQIEAIKKNFNVYAKKTAEPGSNTYSMDHSAQAILLRSDGIFMGTIDVNEPDDAALAKLKRLTAL